jgi:hypothetical protein
VVDHEHINRYTTPNATFQLALLIWQGNNEVGFFIDRPQRLTRFVAVNAVNNDSLDSLE